jgi:hypothetical protein
VSPHFGVTFAQQHLALVLAASADPAHQQEARNLALGWVEVRTGNRVHLGLSHEVLAQVAAASRALEEAEAQARKACEILTPFPLFLSEARWRLSAVLLLQARAAEAREEVALALRELEALGAEGIARVGLLQVLAEACFAQGDTASGEQALRDALQRLRSRAASIPDAAARERYLRQVPENARTLELARQRWGAAEVS